ncbi:MAG: glycosyltransferase family 4 protein [Pseudomonadota bacterium]
MHKKKRLLYYTGHCEIVGGDVKYLFELLQHLDSHQFDITIYADKNKEFSRKIAIDFPEFVSQVKYLETAPTLFHQNFLERYYIYLSQKQNSFLFKVLNWKVKGKSLFQAVNFLYTCASFKYLRDHVRNFFVFYQLFSNKCKDVDIVHFNNGGYPGKLAGGMAIVVAHFFGIKKIIMTVHNEPVERRWYRVSDFLLDYGVAKYCDDLLVPSAIIKQQLIDLRGLPSDKIHVIQCGLKDEPLYSDQMIYLKRQALGLIPEHLVLLIAGNYEDPRKGHHLLLLALAENITNFPTLKLLIVGDGSLQRKQVLDDLVDRLGLDDYVEFLGYRTDMHALNSIADVVVVPSIQGEATPYTIKEAARAGRPVITSTAGGCAEAVEHNVSGLLVPAGDMKALSRALTVLLKDARLRKKMGEQAKSLFLERFLLQDRVEDVIQLYAEQVDDT